MKRLLFIIFLFTLVSHARGMDIAKAGRVAVLETNQGIIEIRLRPDVAPKACENFQRLIETGYYNGLIFHRVIKNFMIT